MMSERVLGVGRAEKNEVAAGEARREAEADYRALSDEYVKALVPIFLPSDPTKPDILDYFGALLRVGGMEDAGWDPYAESRIFLQEIFDLTQIELPDDKFPDADKSTIRLGLLFYNHVVEMDATYEVLANLLRFQLDLGYAFNPFFDFLTKKQKIAYPKRGIYPDQKIKIVCELAERAGIDLHSIFDSFYDNALRNAVAHSSFVITDEHLVCRSFKIGKSFRMSLDELDDKLMRAKAFIGAFFALEKEARRQCGEAAGRSLAYDPHYKGVMEVLVDEDGLMNGFKVHWPNGSDSWYQRTVEGARSVNCLLQTQRPAIDLFVGHYPTDRDDFSPLVGRGQEPNYSNMQCGKPTVWQP